MSSGYPLWTLERAGRWMVIFAFERGRLLPSEAQWDTKIPLRARCCHTESRPSGFPTVWGEPFLDRESPFRQAPSEIVPSDYKYFHTVN